MRSVEDAEWGPGNELQRDPDSDEIGNRADRGQGTAGDAETIGWWLVAYAVVFGMTLVMLAVRLLLRHRGEVALAPAG